MTAGKNGKYIKTLISAKGSVPAAFTRYTALDNRKFTWCIVA